MITVYSTRTCPKCKLLMHRLDDLGQQYQEADLLGLLQDAALMTDLHLAGKSFRSAPVLRVGDEYIGAEELFPGGKLDEEKLRGLI